MPQERNCIVPDCGKPLNRKQKKYCSKVCQFIGQRNPLAERIWALRKERPEMSLLEIAEELDTTLGYVNTALFIRKDRPDLRKRIYKPRKMKLKQIVKEQELLGTVLPERPPPEPKKKPKREALPAGKWGKHPAPSWLWGGGEALEKEYPQFAPKKDKK